MKKYTIDDLVVLLHKLGECLYSWNQLIFFSKEVVVPLQMGIEPTEVNEFRMNYYKDKFLHEISELYTFFYKHDDTTILNQFNASEDERLKLKNVRHPIAHIDGDIDKVLKAQEDFLSATNPTNQIKDLILMVKHLRMVTTSIKAETKFLSHLKMVQDIFPREILAENLRREMFE